MAPPSDHSPRYFKPRLNNFNVYCRTVMEIGIPVPDDIFRHFASDPIGPMLTVSRVVQDPTCSINSALNSFLDNIPSEAIATTYDDLSFSSFWNGDAHLERRARIWIAERVIAKEISRRRIQLFQNQTQSDRPDPYRLPALADLEVDDEQLVKLSEFKFDGSRLLRNGHAFTPFCTTSAPNSMYWFLDILFSEGLAERCSVRLDPFLFGPAETFPAMSYKMWIHGRRLDWKRLSSLSEPDFGRWIPDSMKHRSEFTDFCAGSAGQMRFTLRAKKFQMLRHLQSKEHAICTRYMFLS